MTTPAHVRTDQPARHAPRVPAYGSRGGAGSGLRIAIARPDDDADAEDAAYLLAEQRAWLDRVVGAPVPELQPSAGPEYADPLAFYRPPAGALLLARRWGHPIGVVGVHELAPGCGELKRMFVLPSGRGAGAGRALLRRAIEAAAELGFHRLLLETLPGPMDTAVALYREAGFEDAEPFSFDLAGVIALALDLPRPR
jgi:GNAT superfamily N-acetyltransferase